MVVVVLALVTTEACLLRLLVRQVRRARALAAEARRVAA